MDNNFEKNYTDIITKLGKLKSIKASSVLRNRILSLSIPSLPAQKPYGSPFYLFRLAFIVIIFILLSGTGLIFAAERSHPGDFLYPVKKTVEQTQLTLTKNPAVKTILHINNADKRVDELKETIKHFGNQEVQNVTSDYESQVKNAVREIHKVDKNKEDIERIINQKLENQSQKLEDIQKVAPTEAKISIQKAIDTSKTGQEEINQLQPKKSEEKGDNPTENSDHKD